MGEFSEQEIADMAAETGLTPAQVRETLSGTAPGGDAHDDAHPTSLSPGDDDDGDLVGRTVTLRLPMAPHLAVQEIVRRLERATGTRAQLHDQTRATLADLSYGVAYHVEAVRDSDDHAAVTVYIDPTVARHRYRVSRSGAITNAGVAGMLLLVFGFPGMLTAVTATIVGAGFWFARYTRKRGLRGLSNGRGIAAAALIDAEDQHALPPAT